MPPASLSLPVILSANENACLVLCTERGHPRVDLYFVASHAFLGVHQYSHPRRLALKRPSRRLVRTPSVALEKKQKKEQTFLRRCDEGYRGWLRVASAQELEFQRLSPREVRRYRFGTRVSGKREGGGRACLNQRG